jgi:hypothetical protein
MGTRRDPPRAAVDFAATSAAPTDALMAVCARASTEVSTWSARWTVVVRLDQATNSAMGLIVCDETGSPVLYGAITFTPGPAGTVVEMLTRQRPSSFAFDGSSRGALAALLTMAAATSSRAPKN